ncbi:MAG: hypothetical protein ACR5KW_01505 [Wolbachia sp.]
MGVEIFPVVLYCNDAELIKYVESKERYHVNKITDSDFAIKNTRKKRLFIHESSIEIDSSNMSAKEVAVRTVKRMNNEKNN